MASNNASSSGIYIDLRVGEEKTEDEVMIVATGNAQSEVATSSTSQEPQQPQATTSASTPARISRPQPTEGYIYGFILPFTVSDPEYFVVKIGQTRGDQIVRRLREHNNEFIRATGIPIFTEPILRVTPDEFINSVKWRAGTKVFLASYVIGHQTAAESGARTCIGVAPFNIEPTFRRVFPNSERVTTTEWVVAKKKVVEDIQVAFWHNQLDRFDSVDAFLDKLKELNKRRHVNLTISLESINLEIYHDEVIVPQFVEL